MSEPEHPEQPIVEGPRGDRYLQNPIVRAIYESHPYFAELNRIWQMHYEEKHMRQFYQLIGYSVAGFEEVFEREESEK